MEDRKMKKRAGGQADDDCLRSGDAVGSSASKKSSIFLPLIFLSWVVLSPIFLFSLSVAPLFPL